MAVLIASDLRKDVAGRPLLRGVSFKLERRERLTLAGRNGAGKTTLLRMLAGEDSADGGELHLGKGVRVALHDQRPPRDRGLSLRDYVLEGCAEPLALEAELAGLEEAMAGGAHDERTFARYADAQARFDMLGGYRWRDRASDTLRGLGFDEADLDRALSSFSGGELTRGSLARALASAPDLLLLDEPTNHLDIASLEWLEAELQALDAAVVLVAHDRWFLEAVGTAVLELEDGRGRFFAGPWHKWRQEKAAQELAQGRAAERRQAEIDALERFVTRFRAGTRAKQAQARQKKLDRIGDGEGGPQSATPRKRDADLAFAFKPPQRSGRIVFEVNGGRLEVPERVLLDDVELWLERGEHVALVGPNGTGKTTLIETLVGRRELPAGTLRRGHNVELGFLSQHAEELDDTASVLEAAQRATKLTPNKARALLGRFLFSGEQAEKPVEGLSGGERRRLSLAVLVASGANVLVLDEPTNHLDVSSREALEDALRSFEGAILLVSHDRALLDAVGSRTVAVEDGTLRSYAGGWPEYVRIREERKAEAAAAPKARSKPAKATNGRTKPARTSPKPAEADLERRIEAAEAALAALEEELGDPSAWTDGDRAAASGARHAQARAELDALYERYGAAVG